MVLVEGSEPPINHYEWPIIPFNYSGGGFIQYSSFSKNLIRVRIDNNIVSCEVFMQAGMGHGGSCLSGSAMRLKGQERAVTPS